MKRCRFLQAMLTGPSILSMSCSRGDELDEISSPVSSTIPLTNTTLIDGTGAEPITGAGLDVKIVIHDGVIIRES